MTFPLFAVLQHHPVVRKPIRKNIWDAVYPEIYSFGVLYFDYIDGLVHDCSNTNALAIMIRGLTSHECFVFSCYLCIFVLVPQHRHIRSLKKNMSRLLTSL